MTVSDLIQGAEYSFTVAAVDTSGRVGEKSVTSNVVTLDSEQILIKYNISTTNSNIQVRFAHAHVHTY